MSKVISIRLTDQMKMYLEETQKMRKEIFQVKSDYCLQFEESITEIIKIAIIRLYNQTFDFWADEFVERKIIEQKSNK